MFRAMRSRVTSAHVIAGVALFVALGGVAFGLASNSVKSRHIKDNQVQFRDLKGVKAWNKGAPVTGDDASLAIAQEEAARVPLAKRGPIRIVGRCYRETVTDDVHATIYAETARDGAVIRTTSGSNLGGAFYLNANSSLNDERLATIEADATTSSIDPADAGFVVIGPQRSVYLVGTAAVAAKTATPAGGDGPYGSGDRCLFGGHVIG